MALVPSPCEEKRDNRQPSSVDGQPGSEGVAEMVEAYVITTQADFALIDGE